jgi:nucleoid-associated protein YgaU
LGALTQVISLGTISQAEVQLVDGHQKEQDALAFMDTIERGLVRSVSSPGPRSADDLNFTFDLLYTGAKFSQEGNPLKPIFVVNAKQNPSYPFAANESEACKIKSLLHVIQTEGENVPEGGTQYTVKNGDSLWNIASHFYGDPTFHLLLAASNNIPDNRMNQLISGQPITIDPIGKFRANNQLLFVDKGDSLWGISNDRLKAKEKFSSMKKSNSQMITNPNLIYPIEVLHSPSQ